MENTSKGRTADEKSVDEAAAARAAQPPPQPTPLEIYVNMLRRKSPSLSGRAALINWVNQTPYNAYHLALSNSMEDLRALVGKVFPSPTSADVTVTRGQQQQILSISDPTQILEGPPLTRLLINYGSTLSGNVLTIFSNTLDQGGFTGLVVPALNLVPWSATLTRFDGVDVAVNGFHVISRNQVTNLVIPASDARHIVALSIPPTFMPSILRAVSGLRKVDATFDIVSITSLTDTVTRRTSDQVKRAHIAFLDSLEAAFLATADIDSKISAFSANPSFQFLAKLKLKRPFSKPLFDVNNKPVKRVALSTLPSGASILLQDMGYDGSFYERGLKQDMLVYVPGDFKVKVGKGHKPLGRVDVMTVSDLRRIIAAKEAKSVAVKLEPVEADDDNDDDASMAGTEKKLMKINI